MLIFKKNYLAFGGLFSVGTSNIGAFERRRRSLFCSSQPDGDVFRGIVSVWKKKKQEEVRDDERQKAKQICYGIVYGMGCKSLAEQLEVGEEEAQLFVNTFHARYPKFINHIVMVSTALGQEKENAGTVCYNHDSSYILLRWKTILYCVMTKMLNRRRKQKKETYLTPNYNSKGQALEWDWPPIAMQD
ncbi:hypothetical protein OUZ56_016280 [Daphnia magna]|uniref:DNA-directed DNA polymerase n=1 Tax=Daphnia magna TaxID=35525 RepID=A0ABR0AQ68_9CRUS|nr:hypothetical protein OUZ56_016280 [Daphnia magna]